MIINKKQPTQYLEWVIFLLEYKKTRKLSRVWISSWGDRRDLNPRVPEPQPGALTNFATIAMCFDIIAQIRSGVNKK